MHHKSFADQPEIKSYVHDSKPTSKTPLQYLRSLQSLAAEVTARFFCQKRNTAPTETRTLLFMLSPAR